MHHITKCQRKTGAYIKAIVHLCLRLSLLRTILLSQKNCPGKSSPFSPASTCSWAREEEEELIQQVRTYHDWVTKMPQKQKPASHMLPALPSWASCSDTFQITFRLHIPSPQAHTGTCLPPSRNVGQVNHSQGSGVFNSRRGQEKRRPSVPFGLISRLALSGAKAFLNNLVSLRGPSHLFRTSESPKGRV